MRKSRAVVALNLVQLVHFNSQNSNNEQLNQISFFLIIFLAFILLAIFHNNVWDSTRSNDIDIGMLTFEWTFKPINTLDIFRFLTVGVLHTSHVFSPLLLDIKCIIIVKVKDINTFCCLYVNISRLFTGLCCVPPPRTPPHRQTTPLLPHTEFF